MRLVVNFPRRYSMLAVSEGSLFTWRLTGIRWLVDGSLAHLEMLAAVRKLQCRLAIRPGQPGFYQKTFLTVQAHLRYWIRQDPAVRTRSRAVQPNCASTGSRISLACRFALAESSLSYAAVLLSLPHLRTIALCSSLTGTDGTTSSRPGPFRAKWWCDSAPGGVQVLATL